MKSARSDSMRENIRSSLWFLPSITIIVSLLLCFLLVRIDRAALGSAGTTDTLFGITADGARSVLEVIAGSVLTVMTLMYSLTIVALQIASDQYSPRLLRTFLRDIGNQIVISIFLGTFAYCLVLLPNIRTGGQGQGVEVVPPTAFAILAVWTLASLAALVYFIHHIAQSIRIDTIMQRVETDTLAAIDRNYPDTVAGQEWSDPLPEVPRHAAPVTAAQSGFIRTIDPADLLDLARTEDLLIVFERSIGEHVVAGIPVGWVWRKGGGPMGDTAALVRRINGSVHVGAERSLKQDVAFGVRQLVDVAVKAASEVGCDPATAADAIAHIAVLLSRLSERRLSNHLLYDAQHTVRVGIPRRDFAAYVDLGTSEIRRYRLDDTDIPTLLLDMLRTVGRLCPTEDRRAVIARQIDIVLDDALRRVEIPSDREALTAAADAAREALEAGRRRAPSLQGLPELPFV